MIAARGLTKAIAARAMAVANRNRQVTGHVAARDDRAVRLHFCKDFAENEKEVLRALGLACQGGVALNEIAGAAGIRIAEDHGVEERARVLDLGQQIGNDGALAWHVQRRGRFAISQQEHILAAAGVAVRFEQLQRLPQAQIHSCVAAFDIVIGRLQRRGQPTAVFRAAHLLQEAQRADALCRTVKAQDRYAVGAVGQMYQ